MKLASPVAIRIQILIILLSVLLHPTISASRDRIVLQLRWDHQFQFAGYYAAQWQGFYEQEDLDVEIRSALQESGRILSAVEEVQAGRAHVGIGAADILSANDSGSDLTVVASVFQQSAARFFMKQETPFASLADLTHLRVARRVNDLIDVELQSMLLKEGIDPAKVPPHPHQPGLNHLLDDTIQVLPGYLTSTPFHRDLNGQPFKEIRPMDYGVDFYGDTLFALYELTRRQPEMVARFVAASMAGWRYALENPDVIAARISTELERVDRLDKPLAFNRFQIEAVRALTLYPIVKLGNINPSRWATMHTSMRESGQVQNDLDMDRFVFNPERLAAQEHARLMSFIYWGLAISFSALLFSLVWLRTLKTQVKQQTFDLRRKEEKFRALATHAPNIIFSTDTDLKITYINRTLNDSEVTDIVGRHISNLTPDDQIEAVLSRVATVRSTRQPVHYETVSKADFGDFWLDVRLGPMIQNDVVNGFIFILTDITERKRAEKALVESERRLATLISNLPGMAYRCGLDRDWTMAFVSEGCRQLTGYAPEDLIGNTTIAYGQLIHTDDGQMVWDVIQEALDKQLPFQCTYRIHNAAMQEKWVWEQGQGVFGKAGEIVALEGFITDITERKRAEQALQSAHERFLTVLNSLDATIYVADMQTHEILFMNQNMIEVFGGDFTGDICWRAFRREPGPCSQCTNAQLLNEDGAPSGVCTWQARNPVTGRYYINNDRAIVWTDGRLVRLQIATDITDIKQMEEELRQAHKMEAIGTLAGGIAHDFNNILSSIIGFTELALDDIEQGSTLEDNILEVYAAGIRAKGLVKQILMFARQSEEELKPIQVDAVVNEVLKLIRSSLPSTIEITSVIDSNARILGNTVHVHQILMNLCTNAAHAMASKGGMLSVSLKESRIDLNHSMGKQGLKPGAYIEIEVADSGEGISPAVIDSIFEPYFTTKPTGDGTGMGLAVVHGIVESYGGKIFVESTLGKGTVFELFLPTTRKRQTRLTEEAEGIPTGTERILLVDDEEAIAKMGSQLLTRLGYAVTSRTSSVEALGLFRSKPDQFDLVITDMTMPNMTGDVLAAHLIEIQPEIPIILCTGYSQQMTEDRAFDIGISAFAYKPIVKAELAKTVRNVLDALAPEGTLAE